MSVVIDHRCRHPVRENAEFYIYIKYPISHIFYVEYKINNKYSVVISTRTTTPEAAFEFAVENKDKIMAGLIHRVSKKTKPTQIFYRKTLLAYYQPSSEWLRYDISHGRKTPENARKIYQSFMIEISELTPDVREFEQLDLP